jgi:hypothetical protein
MSTRSRQSRNSSETRQCVAGVGGGGDVSERGPLQRGDLRGGGGVLEQPHAVGGPEALGDAFGPHEEAGLEEDVALPQ